MADPIKELMLPCLSQWGFYPSDNPGNLNREGKYYELSSHLGEGYYWYYEREGMFALAVMDLRLKEDTVIEYKQPDFMSIAYYDTVSAEQLTTYKRLNANCVRGHVSDQQIFRVKYHKDIPIRGMELMLVPGYFCNYLNLKYPDKFPDPRAAFLNIDGSSDFPELLLLMRQIQAFQGVGATAHLFYESKVAEAVSLILEKTTVSKTSYQVKRELSFEDIQNLDTVKSYIADHCAFDLRIEQLAKIACMSQSKLRYCFKRCCGCTLTEYIQNKRIAQAEYMLLKTDLQINQIAKAVGYNHAVHFSSLFQKSTGLLPEEYRHLMRRT